MSDARQQVGDGSNAVQVIGEGNSVSIVVGAARLTFDLKHKLNVRRARNDRELLQTEQREITLVGRDEELRALATWLGSGDEISVRCITGQAGSGKTRLGIELCERAEVAGWRAGFVRHADLAENLTGWHWGEKNTLAVVDYAAASAQGVKAWLEGLAALPPRPAKLRILLLERYAETDRGWWQQVFAGRGLTGRGPDDLLDPPAPVPLQPLASQAHRRALLTEVMAKAAALNGVAPVPAPPAPGQDTLFDKRLADDPDTHEPLFLAMAGVVAVTAGAPAALALSRTDLAHRVASGESHRLDRRAAGLGVDGGLLRHLAACATLQGGCDPAALDALIAEEVDATGPYPPFPRERLANALRDAFPAESGDGAAPIRPDLIGEAFVLDEIGRDRPMAKQTSIAARAHARAGMAAIQTILRAAQNFCAGDKNHRSLLWLDRLAGPDADLPRLRSIVSALPYQTVALRERAAAFQGRVANKFRDLAAARPDWEPFQDALAGAQNDLANRLGDIGRLEDALICSQDAVALYDALADRRPDAFLPHLAGAMNNLGCRLADLGRITEALPIAEKTVALCRTLAARNPEAFRSNLANALNNLANRLSDLDRPDDALSAADETTALYRALAQQMPEAFLPDLAISLNNLGNRFSALDQLNDALRCAGEAVTLFRTLATQRPDAFQPYLAGALMNHALKLDMSGQKADALANAEQAAALYRTLAARLPDAFLPEHARAQGVVAICLDKLDRPEAGLAASAGAIRSLTGPFLARPRVLADQIGRLARGYLDRCAALGVPPDYELLDPVAMAFECLRAEQEKPP